MLVNSIQRALNRHKKWAVLFLVVLLGILTNKMLLTVNRFEVVDQQLLSDPSFSSWQSDWVLVGRSDVHVSKTQLDLVNSSNFSGSLEQQIELNEHGFVRLEAEVGAEKLMLGDQSWAGGAVALVYYDESGDRIKQSAVIRVLSDSPISKSEHIERIDGTAARLGISIRLLRASGTFSLRNLSLSRLAETAAYKHAKGIFIILWAVVLFYGLFLGISLLRIEHMLFIGGLMSITLVLILTPYASVISQYFWALMYWLSYSLLPNDVAQQIMVSVGRVDSSQLGHFALFFTLGLILSSSMRQHNRVFGFCCLVTLAYITEILQLFVDSRSSNIVDFYIDVFGALVGFSISIAILRLRCTLVVN